jgi:hypothetical protein
MFMAAFLEESREHAPGERRACTGHAAAARL